MADKSTGQADQTASEEVKFDCGCPGQAVVLANQIKCSCEQNCNCAGTSAQPESASAENLCSDTCKAGKTCSVGYCECSMDCMCPKCRLLCAGK